MTDRKLAVIQWSALAAGSALGAVIGHAYRVPSLLVLLPLCLVGMAGIASGMRP